MKKVIAIATMMILTFGAFAAGSLSANDCTVGKITSKTTVKGFTFIPEKGIDIQDKSAEPIKNGDVAYSKRIQTKGTQGAIEFTAKAGEKVLVVAASSAKDADRNFVFVNAKGKTIHKILAPKWNIADPKFSTEEFTIPEDGTYKIRGNDGGLYFFEVNVR